MEPSRQARTARNRPRYPRLGLLLLLGLLGAACGAATTADAPLDEGGVPPGAALLSWAPNREGDLAGYRVHLGRTSNRYDETVDVGLSTTHMFENLAPGTYYFAVTAYDLDGNESALSAEVSKTVR